MALARFLRTLAILLTLTTAGAIGYSALGLATRSTALIVAFLVGGWGCILSGMGGSTVGGGQALDPASEPLWQAASRDDLQSSFSIRGRRFFVTRAAILLICAIVLVALSSAILLFR